MELNICHLYPDLLNVYGDLGNILILKNRCEERGIKVNIHNLSLGEPFQKELYDIVFFGGRRVDLLGLALVELYGFFHL